MIRELAYFVLQVLAFVALFGLVRVCTEAMA